MCWKSITIDEINTVPQSSGVYVAYIDKKLRYVGESKDLRRRLKCHLYTASRVLTEVSRLTFKYRELVERKQLEARLIKRLKPVGSRQHGLRERNDRLRAAYWLQRSKIEMANQVEQETQATKIQY